MKDKVVVVTGCAQGIGKAVADRFRALGARVAGIDVLPGDHFVGDVANDLTLHDFVEETVRRHGGVDYLVNNACTSFGGLATCDWDDFNYVLQVGVAAPFYLTKLLLPHFREGAAVVNISSTRYLMSQPDTESYSAAKGGITSLTHAMAVSLSGKVRVNAIAPGWIDVRGEALRGPDHAQHPAGRVGAPEDIANAVLFLCGAESGFITGQVLTVDGGMTRQMIYHNDEGWFYQPKK